MPIEEPHPTVEVTTADTNPTDSEAISRNSATSGPQVPGYEVISELGRGGMGVVYRAKQVKLNRDVALKMILGPNHTGSKDIIRFLAEAEAVASIRHPNVVQVYDYGDYAGMPFMALEFCSGGALAGRLRSGPIAHAVAAELLAKIARGVGAAHDLGIIHRDIKPGNILLHDEFGNSEMAAFASLTPKVADFGLAKRPLAADLTGSGAILGTPAYMAPEQAKGESKYVGPTADVWALGVVLYECLTGVTPFVADGDQYGVLLNVMSKEPVSPRQLVRLLPSDLELICLKCLAKEPTERYATAGFLADDLERFATGEPLSIRPSGVVERTYRWAKRKPTLAAAVSLSVLALTLACLAFGAIALWQQAESDRKLADSSRISAEQGRQNELAARAIAETAKSDAETAQFAEKNAKLEFAKLNAVRTVGIAHEEYLHANIFRTRALLDEISPEYRSTWEYRYVHRLAHREQMVIEKAHVGGVTALQITPDGRTVLTGGMDGLIKGWSLDEGRELFVYDGHAKAIGEFTKQPSFGGGAAGKSVKGGKNEGKQMLGGVGGFASTIDSVQLIGNRIVISKGGFFSPVRVWKLDTRADVYVEKTDNGKMMQCADYDDQRGYLALAYRTVTNEGFYRVNDVKTNATIFEIKITDQKFQQMFCKLCGNGILYRDGNRLIRVELSSQQQVFEIEIKDGTIESISTTQNARLLALGTTGGLVRIYECETGRERGKMQTTEPLLNHVAINPDGTVIATASKAGGVNLWKSGQTKQIHHFLGHSASVRNLAFTSEGERLITVGDDRSIRVWDTRSVSPRVSLQKPENAVERPVGSFGMTRISPSIFSKDGQEFLTASGDRLTLWTTTNPGKRWTKTLEGIPIQTLALNSPQQVIYMGDAGGIIHKLSYRDGKEISTHRVFDAPDPRFSMTFFPNGGRGISSVAVSPNGDNLLIGGGDGRWKLFDISHNRFEEVASEKIFTFPVEAVAFSLDSRLMATGTMYNGLVTLWDVKTRNQISQLTGQRKAWNVMANEFQQVQATHDNSISFIQFGPNNRILTGGGDGFARLWDTTTGKELHAFEGSSPSMCHGAFTRDGSRIVTTTGQVIRIWDAESGREVLVFRKPEANDPNGSAGVSEVLHIAPDDTLRALTIPDLVLSTWDLNPPGIGKHLSTSKD